MIVQYGFNETITPSERNEGNDKVEVLVKSSQTLDEEDKPFLLRRDEHEGEVNNDHYRGGCIKKITKIIDIYVLRKSYSPIEWILDLRAYGMKI